MPDIHRKTYTCPMHPEVLSEEPGKCPICQMDLIVTDGTRKSSANPFIKKKGLRSFLPLIIIFGLLSAASLIQVYVMRRTILDEAAVNASVGFSWGVKIFMLSFMGGFFLVFGGFKLLDVKGFAHGFQTYDVVAKRLPVYGVLYPFLELTLGFLLLLHVAVWQASLVALVISIIGMIGVGIKLRKREIIQCVCLGTVFDLPLTNITLFENLIMAVMALGMLFS